jgi:polysaccharide export outer membrane protein
MKPAKHNYPQTDAHAASVWQNARAALRRLGALAALGIAVQAHAASDHLLGPGDSVRVTVFQNPDLTTEARISAQGTIRMPLVGVIELNGQTPDNAAGLIAQRLKDGQFLKEPEVGVTLMTLRSRQVSVLGQVARPGKYVIEEAGARLTDILALAGGITATGDDTVSVMTQRNGATEKLGVSVAALYGTGGDPSANIELEGGDTVFVQRAPVFYIYGAVQRAGSYKLEPNLNVIQALSLGGGITPRGTERGMKIHRQSADGNLAKIDAQPSDKIQADDVIFVKESLF